MAQAPTTPASTPAAYPAAHSLSRDIAKLEGVGPTRAKELRARNINTLGDLIEYFPRAYQQERSERPIAELVAEQIQIARGEVVAVDYIPARPRPRFEATLRDSSGKLSLVWFNGAYLRRLIHPGKILRVQGKVRLFRNMPSMTQAKFEEVEADTEVAGEDILRAVYPATSKLSSLGLWQIIDRNIDTALEGIDEWFDPALLKRRGLIDRRHAFRAIHQPTDWNEAG